MVNLCTPPALILASCLSLSACGAIEDYKNAVAFADQRDAFSNRRNALAARSNSTYATIPDSGTATYLGEASLGVGTTGSGIVLIGDAELIVDFGTETLDGSLTNFDGYDSGENYANYGGTLVIVDGAIGVDRPNDLEGQIIGTL